MRDNELAATVDHFNQKNHPARLLICSDVASEGINLHHLSHRMIHFDIPWSLMVFQQRNGRIDRYGQTRTPQIRYLQTTSSNEHVRGDQRILEILIEKDDTARKNIGDPSEFLGVYDQQAEEELVGSFMETKELESGNLLEQFLRKSERLEQENRGGLGTVAPSGKTPASSKVEPLPALFETELNYARAGLRWLREAGEDMDSAVENDV